MTYSQAWFRSRSKRANADAHYGVPEVSAALGKCPASVIDFGAGDGSWLRWWGEMGTRSRIGVDLHGPDDWARNGRGLHVRADLTKPINLGVRADLVQCLEVAEHLPETAADTLLDTLAAHGDRVLFSAAPPGQGGTDHLNEQPWPYWAEKWERRGFRAMDIIRHRLPAMMSPWYRANTVLMVRKGHEVVVPTCKITTARYRDAFKDVCDAMNTLAMDVRWLPQRWGALPFGMHELAYDACVDKMRSQLATESCEEPVWSDCDYSLWIDADNVFTPQQAIDLVVATHAHGWEIGSGVYTTKEKEARIVHRVASKNREIALGPYAPPVTVDGVGFGFVCTRNDVFARIANDPRSGVERTWFGEGKFYWDLFKPMRTAPNMDWLDPDSGVACGAYYSEDVSFCERATACEIPIWLYPQVFVRHRGRWDFSIENLKLKESA